MSNPQQLKLPKLLIKAAFERGDRLTTYTGNQIGHAVDFRKLYQRFGMRVSQSRTIGNRLRRTQVQGLLSRKAKPEAVRGQ